MNDLLDNPLDSLGYEEKTHFHHWMPEHRKITARQTQKVKASRHSRTSTVRQEAHQTQTDRLNKPRQDTNCLQSKQSRTETTLLNPNKLKSTKLQLVWPRHKCKQVNTKEVESMTMEKAGGEAMSLLTMTLSWAL